jgi:hypothetical protein
MKHTNLLSNKLGNFYTNLVIVIVLFVADITYVVVALVANRFFDSFLSYTLGNVNLINLQSTLRYVGPIAIVVINIGLIVLLLVSAWKRGSNESPMEDLSL